VDALLKKPGAYGESPSSFHTTVMSSGSDPEREHALQEYKTKLLESREWEAKLKALRLEIKGSQRDFDVSEDNIKALQSVGQIIGEVLKQLDDERCKWNVQLYPSSILTNLFSQSSSKLHQGRDTLSDADRRSTRRS